MSLNGHYTRRKTVWIFKCAIKKKIMTTTKDYIRKTAWFTSNGLPDPRLEGPETTVAFDMEVYWHRFKTLGSVISVFWIRITGKRKELFNR